MAEAREMEHAQEVYADLCTSLEKRELKFEKHDEDLVITFDFSGDDFPMSFVLAVDPDRQLLRVFSKLPFTVPEDKRIDLAIATCVATNGLADGSFDYDISTGEIVFRLTASFRDSKIGDELFEYLVGISVTIVDKYNDQFFAIGKGLMSVNDFIAKR